MRSILIALLVLRTRIRAGSQFIPVPHSITRKDSTVSAEAPFFSDFRSCPTYDIVVGTNTANGVAFCTCDLATTTLCVALKLKIFLETKRLAGD